MKKIDKIIDSLNNMTKDDFADNKIKNYYVEVPVILKLMVGVDAYSEEDAIEKVFDSNIEIEAYDNKNEFDFVDYEWEMFKKVNEGNVYCGGISEVYVEEEE